jgi:glyoxylase-like metal-dependent hydrolase (beta-lactamase superfamily II)
MTPLQIGLIRDGFYALGLNWSAMYLLDGRRPVLFESGFACAAKLYKKDLVAILGKRSPEILFITHMHWDHCGSAAYFKKEFPSLKIAASDRAAQIIKRPNALKLIASLSEEVVPLVAAAPEIDDTQLLRDAFRPFDVDILLHDGQTIELEEDLTVEVLATPGHTRDHISYYIPERRILVATEATGGLDRAGNIITEFLVDFDLYMASLRRLASLDVEILCQGHHFVFVGADQVKRFFARSIEEAERFKAHVFELLDSESGSVERVVKRVKHEQWDTNTSIKQAEGAYLLNLRARVSHLADVWAAQGHAKERFPTR